MNWCWSWSSNTLASWCKELIHWKRPWCWDRLKAGGEGENRGWDGWMALLTQWTRVWAISRSRWWTGKPGMLQSTGSPRVGHNWATELTCLALICNCCFSVPKSCPTICDPMDSSTPDFPVLHYLLECVQLMSAKWMMSSNHLILCHMLLFLPSVFP